MPQKVKRGALKGFSGKVEDLNLVMRQMRDGATVFARLPEKPKVPPRSPKQMKHRIFMASICAAWPAFKQWLQESFERTRVGQQMRGQFISKNVNRFGVYLTKEQREDGYQVLNHFQVSDGTVPPVEVALSDDKSLFLTNIAVGQLQITEATTVKEFALAVGLNSEGVFHINNNPDTVMMDHDSVSVLFAYQFEDPTTHKPTIRAQQYQVPLRLDEWAARTPLSQCIPLSEVSVVDRELQGTVRHVVAFPAGDRKMCAVIHSRRRADRSILCSRQFLVGENSLLADYLTVDAKRSAYESYGGTNWQDEYDPDNEPTISDGQQAPRLGQQAPDSFSPVPGGSTMRQVTVTCTVSGGHGSVSPATATVNVGASVTFTASPDQGYEPVWPGGSHALTYTITATESTSIALSFRLVSGGGGSGGGGGEIPELG